MKYRIKAALIHLSISSLVIGSFLWLVFAIWYPYPYDRLLGVWDALTIMVLVDIVLGPTLTLVVFNVEKASSELRRDLSIIALIQISALVWGVHVTYSMRPLINVFAVNQFYIFNPQTFSNLKVNSEVLPGVLDQPRLAYSDINQQDEQFDSVMRAIIEGDVDQGLFLDPERYLPFAEHKSEVKKQAMDYERLIASGKASERLVKRFLQSHGGQAEDYWYIPVTADVSNRGILVMDKSLDRVVGIL